MLSGDDVERALQVVVASASVLNAQLLGGRVRAARARAVRRRRPRRRVRRVPRRARRRDAHRRDRRDQRGRRVLGWTSTHCADNVTNAGETGVDCGGGACAPCATGVSCAADSDCARGAMRRGRRVRRAGEGVPGDCSGRGARARRRRGRASPRACAPRTCGGASALRVTPAGSATRAASTPRASPRPRRCASSCSRRSRVRPSSRTSTRPRPTRRAATLRALVAPAPSQLDGAAVAGARLAARGGRARRRALPRRPARTTRPRPARQRFTPARPPRSARRSTGCSRRTC